MTQQTLSMKRLVTPLLSVFLVLGILGMASAGSYYYSYDYQSPSKGHTMNYDEKYNYGKSKQGYSMNYDKRMMYSYDSSKDFSHKKDLSYSFDKYSKVKYNLDYKHEYDYGYYRYD